MESLLQDVRHGARVLIKSPGFTLAALLTLTLGIGANTAIFSVVSAVLLHPLPFADPGRLVMIWERNQAKGRESELVSAPDFEDWRSTGRAFESMAASRDALYVLTGAGEPESLISYRFSSDFFHVLGVQPALGRTFLPEEDRPGADGVVVLSHALWKRRFGGDPAVVGRSITLSDRSYTVVGVMPEGFFHPQQAELWTPLALEASAASRRDLRFLRVMARLRPGATLGDAQSEVDAIMARLARESPQTNAGQGAHVVTVRSQYVGDIQPALIVLSAAVGFVLLIACANVANLSLARTVTRRREMAVRAAVGGGRARLVRQLLTESLLLSCLGGALGLLLAVWIVGFLLAIFPNNIANLSIPRVTEIPIDGRVMGFSLAITLLTGLLFGLGPALQATRRDLSAALGDASPRSGAVSGGRRVSGLLVVAQTALAVVLLAGAGLMIRSFIHLQRSDLGLREDHVLAAQVFLPQSRYPDAGKRRDFLDGVLRRLSVLHGVRSAGATNFLPLTGFWGTVGYTVEGRPRPRPGEETEADNRLASPGYFKTMGIRLTRGRDFDERDRDGLTQVAIVNETLARRWWPGEDPVGRRLDLGDAGRPSWWEIVGVAGDVKAFGPDNEPHAEIYRPCAQVPFPLIAFVARTDADPMDLAASMRAEIWAIDRDQPIFKVVSMAQLVSDASALRRISMVMMSSLALLAIVLAGLGIYGVLSYSVSRRTQEIGLRMALGARPGDMLRLIVGQGMALMAAGVVLGLASAFALVRFLSSLLYGVDPVDPATFTGVVILLGLVALTACWLPARRAALVEPMTALRRE